MGTKPKPLPYERLGVASARMLTTKRLRLLRHALVLERHSEPLAVVVPMDWYSEVIDLLTGRTHPSDGGERER